MLYVSTRNTTDTYTAHHAIYESSAPDGGFYVPFHLPVFTEEELAAFKTQTCSETVAQLLNLLFGLHLSGWDVECKISRTPIKLETMQHKLLIAECWRNPDASFEYLTKCLYSLMTDNKSLGKSPAGWVRIGIEIALLFSLYSILEDMPQKPDIAVTAGDFADLTAISYAKQMGLPVNMTVCSCSENCTFWDLVNRGEFAANTLESADMQDYLECYLYSCFGADEVQRYLNAAERKANYYIDEQKQIHLNANVFTAVVSRNREDVVASNMFRTNGYSLDSDSALAFGGLQDYRSSTGINMHTLIISKKRPARAKE